MLWHEIKSVASDANGVTAAVDPEQVVDEAGAGEKLDAGATLVQVYTGMIYEGPFFAARLARACGERQRIDVGL